MDFSATYVRASDQYLSSSILHTSLTGDFTLEFWWKPASLTAGQDQTFYQVNHSSGGTPVRLWKTDTAGVNKLHLLCQEVGGAAPAAAEHVEIEWDVDALIATSTWVHIAVAFDVSQAVATIAELYTDGVSRGNGSVISGTDCSSIIAGDVSHYIGSDGAGVAIDGQIFAWRLWLELRDSGEVSSLYQEVLYNSITGAIRQNLYKSGEHHVNAAFALSTVIFSEVNGPIGFAEDIPADINHERGRGPGGVMIGAGEDVVPTGTGELTQLGGEISSDHVEDLITYTVVPWVGQPAVLEELSSTSSAPAIVYRMRAFDTNLNRTVYWTSEIVDVDGADYAAGNPLDLTDLVLSNVICQR